MKHPLDFQRQFQAMKVYLQLYFSEKVIKVGVDKFTKILKVVLRDHQDANTKWPKALFRKLIQIT